MWKCGRCSKECSSDYVLGRVKLWSDSIDVGCYLPETDMYLCLECKVDLENFLLNGKDRWRE